MRKYIIFGKRTSQIVQFGLKRITLPQPNIGMLIVQGRFLVISLNVSVSLFSVQLHLFLTNQMFNLMTFSMFGTIF